MKELFINLKEIFINIKDFIFNNLLDLSVGIFITVIFLIIYFLLLKFKFKEKSSLNDLFNISLQGMSLHSGFVLICKTLYYIDDKSKFGIFKEDYVFILLGGVGIIYVSLDAMKKKYEDLKLSYENRLPDNAS